MNSVSVGGAVGKRGQVAGDGCHAKRRARAATTPRAPAVVPEHAGGAHACGNGTDGAGDDHLAQAVAGESQRHRATAQAGGAEVASHDMVSG